MSNPFRKSTSDPAHTSTPSTNLSSASPAQYELVEAPPARATRGPEDLHKSNPFSAFYQHPSTRSSLERAQAESRNHLPLTRTSSNDDDLEAANNTVGRSAPAIIVSEELEKYKSTSNQSSVRPSRTNTGLKAFPTTQIHQVPSRESVWPSRKEQEAQAKLAKRSRLRKNWHCMSGLPRRQRLTIQTLIVLLVIAGAVGIGVGISQAVGGTTYSNTPGQTKPIPDADGH